MNQSNFEDTEAPKGGAVAWLMITLILVFIAVFFVCVL
jgi:cbb3-type cytochrome oxidase subunit 3